MKLLNCLDCNDIVALRTGDMRLCTCGASRGRYLDDKFTVEFEGNAGIIALLNQEYFMSLKPDALAGVVFHWVGVSEQDPAVRYLGKSDCYSIDPGIQDRTEPGIHGVVE